MVPIKAAPVQQQMEQLTLTPEDSEKAGLPSQEQQAKNIDLAAEAKKWNKPIIDASGKYITEQDITDAPVSYTHLSPVSLIDFIRDLHSLFAAKSPRKIGVWIPWIAGGQ